MLIFKPVKNTELGEKFMDDVRDIGYIAYDEADKEQGYIVFHLDGYSMEIICAEVYDSDAETYEGLMRSALNYCGNRNAYIAYYSAENAVDVALMLGFKKNGDRLYGEIPFLLQGHCCGGKQTGKD